MEEKQGPFKIDLSASDGSDENISNIITPKKTNGLKSSMPVSAATKSHATVYISIGLVLIGILFVIGYLSLWNAIKAINISGTEEMANLSKELNEKIASVNQLIEDQKKSLKDDIAGMNSKIKSLESNVSAVNKAEKNNKSELQSSISDIRKDLDPIQKQLESLKAQTDKMIAKTDEITGSMAKFQSAIQKNQQDIEKLAASAVDAGKLENALKKERDANKQTLNTLTNDITTLKKSIKDMEDRLSKIKAFSSPSTAPSSPPSSAPSTRIQTPSTRPSAPKSGGIIEEEIY